ncbi:MAG: hypothetical protein QXT65_04530 [Candidatus Nitrosocaldaceae archaeon]
MRINIDRIDVKKTLYPFLKLSEFRGWIVFKLLSDVRHIPRTGKMLTSQDVVDIQVIESNPSLSEKYYTLNVQYAALRDKITRYKQNDTVLMVVDKKPNERYYRFILMDINEAKRQGIIEDLDQQGTIAT